MTRINCQISNWLLLTIGTLLVFVACRKHDYSVNQPKVSLKEQFFKLPSNASQDLQKIAAIIKSQDEKNNFLSDLIKKDGLPLWKKFFN